MAIGVAATIAPLLFFKYYGFFTVNVTNTATALGLPLAPPLIQVVLPVGVSFYTFMAISYVVDVYRRRVPASRRGSTSPCTCRSSRTSSPGRSCGPSELIPQLDIAARRPPRRRRRRGLADPRRSLQEGGDRELPRRPRSSTRSSATRRATGALEIARRRSSPTRCRSTATSRGYTDIAIGVAKLLGFQFPQNFDRPYSARSVQEFWRRWHMTLSRWLRDYLYIPLGGNRKGTVRTYVNLMLTMLLGGLWHGAAWHFVVWGGLHGGLPGGRALEAAPCVNAGSSRRRPTRGGPMRCSGPRRFVLVCVAWVFFRADSVGTALSMLGRLVHVREGHRPPLITVPVLLAIAIGLATQFVPHAPGAADPAPRSPGCTRSRWASPRRSSCSRSRPSGHAAWHPSSTSSSDERADRRPPEQARPRAPAPPRDARRPGVRGARRLRSSCGRCCTRRSSSARRRRAPVGTRRTVSLALLAPLVWLTDHIGLTAAAERGVARRRPRPERREVVAA